MLESLRRSVGALLAALAAGNALAQPVSLNVASGTATIVSQNQSGGAWTVAILVTTGSPAVFTVTTGTSNVVVEKIEVECDADCLMSVNQTGGGSFSEIRSIVERPTSSPESFDIGTIAIGGSLGPGDVAAEAIGTIDIGGDLTATVTAGPRASSADSDISLIDVGGDIIDADILCYYGAITQVLAGGVIEGDAGVDTVWIMARDGIREIEADAMDGVDIWANYTGASLPLATGTTSSLKCRSGPFEGSTFVAYAFVEDIAVANPGIFIDGDADGSLWVQTTFRCPIEITGDLVGDIFASYGGLDHGTNTSGDITIHGDMVAGSWIYCWAPDGHIRTLVRVGGDFDGEFVVVSLADGTDHGQVIFNASDVGGQWTGDFQVGPTNILDPTPHYQEEDLLGAVGLVPFALHDGDCIPENGGLATVQDEFTVDLAFYGPVTWGTGFPFLVQYTDNGSSWTTDTGWTTLSGKGTRFVTLIYTDDPAMIPAGRQFRVFPVLTGSNSLLCDKLLAEGDVPADDFVYLFDTP